MKTFLNSILSSNRNSKVDTEMKMLSWLMINLLIFSLRWKEKTKPKSITCKSLTLEKMTTMTMVCWMSSEVLKMMTKKKSFKCKPNRSLSRKLLPVCTMTSSRSSSLSTEQRRSKRSLPHKLQNPTLTKSSLNSKCSHNKDTRFSWKRSTSSKLKSHRTKLPKLRHV